MFITDQCLESGFISAPFLKGALNCRAWVPNYNNDWGVSFDAILVWMMV
jgi:hypothetical protein